MKTVPTLCATATLVGASAVGLSFGRENPSPPSLSKKKATPARDQDHRPMSALVQTATTAAPALPLSSSPLALPPSSSANPLTTRCAYDARSQRSSIRRPRAMTVEHPRQPRSFGLDDGAPPGHHHEIVDDVEPATNLANRRHSWIKRLSISTSHNSSRNSSPGPLSPSVSLSNGSMAFSHDGSTAPIIGKRPPSPLPPNKLVKRSSSVVHVSEFPHQGSGSRLPSLRRPATSHQRSATLRHHTALMEMTAEASSIDELSLPSQSDVDLQYTQFFTVKVSKESKRRSAPVYGQRVRRILPNEQHKPTLMLAKAVSPGTGEFDELSSDDGDSVYLVSRPGTPMTISAFAISPDANNRVEAEQVHNESSSEAPDNVVRPRRSFSISDILSPGLRVKKQRPSKAPAAKLTRKSSQRANSDPVLTMGSRKRSNTTHGEHAATSAPQDLTDPALVRRDIAISAGSAENGSSRNDLSGFSFSSPSSALSPPGAVVMGEPSPTSMHPSHVRQASSATSNHVPPSPTLASAAGQHSRHSVAPSEQASTLVGSDNEARGIASGDESDADLQSETLYDSLRTGATRSTSGARGPRIETIFDESPPSRTKVTALRDLLPRGTFREHTADDAPGQQSIAEEEESISTPVRTIVPERSINGSPTLSRGHGPPLFPSLTSTPPDMPKPLSLGTLEWDSRPEDGSSRWSVEDEEEEGNSWADFDSLPPTTHIARPELLGSHHPRTITIGSSPKPYNFQPTTTDHVDKDTRSSIFDWSEQQPTDKSSGNRTPPRPRTVHGKKDADRRGSRTVGRRVPSGLHARSQSVPVVPDGPGKRDTVVTNKFGTWGVGSKGVTEDWNDDFDFSEINEESAVEDSKESHRVDSGTSMVVPKTIQEQQTNVLANIGLLREWGLLIEELKEHRVRAVNLGLLEGPGAGIWEEVDAMIDLADQEAENDGLPRLSTPSTPGFDEGAFDDVSDPFSNHVSNLRRTSGGLASEELGKQNASANQQSPRPRQTAIFPQHQAVSSSPVRPSQEIPNTGSEPRVIVTRPRKDSEAKAQSIIEALQRRKSIQPATEPKLAPPTKKVPFDTATLRRIVPYVNTLTRKVKDALREAEGLYTSPSTSPREPSFSKMFHADNNDIAARMKVMTIM